MSIEINGAGVITGVDSLSTPAVTNAAGSASAPSITFTGDANTGLYSPGADQVAIATGGTARLYIDSSGRVGVGSTAPAGQLSCTSDFVFGNQASTGSGGTGRILATGGEVYIQGGLAASSGSAAPIVFTSYGGVGERARLDASGRLLVGTSSYSDGATLVLQGNSTNSSWESVVRMLRNISNPAADNTLGTFIFGVGSAQGAQISALTDAQWGTNDYPTRLVFSTTADGASSPTERLRIANTGAIGLSGANYGTSGQVLTSNGSASAPSWQTPTASVDALGGVGSYALCSYTAQSTLAAGSTVAANQLSYANVNGNNSGGPSSGTWRLHGITSNGAGAPSISLWIRIS